MTRSPWHVSGWRLELHAPGAQFLAVPIHVINSKVDLDPSGAHGLTGFHPDMEPVSTADAKVAGVL